MKIIILISFLILTTHIKAQDSEIFDITWYLYASSGETELDPPIEADPCETPLSIYFEQNNTFHGRGVCSEFTGNWDYDPVDNVFFLSNFNNIVIDPCDNSCSYDPNTGPSFPLFIFLLDRYSNNQEALWIDIFQTNDIRHMQISEPSWTWLIFGDMPLLSSPDITNRTFSIYPNPTSSVLLFSSNSNIPIKRLTVYSNLGKIILRENIFSSNSLDISILKSGLYFVEIISDTGREIHKIVKI